MKAKSFTFLVLAMSIAALISGCATLGGGLPGGDLEQAVSLINQGDANLLTHNSALPFVFEGEILLRESDVAAVWRNLSINGFRLDSEGIRETAKIDDSSYRLFSSAEEMKVFFSKYVPSDSTLGRIESDDKEYYLLLGKVSAGVPQILGITGF